MPIVMIDILSNLWHFSEGFKISPFLRTCKSLNTISAFQNGRRSTGTYYAQSCVVVYKACVKLMSKIPDVGTMSSILAWK